MAADIATNDWDSHSQWELGPQSDDRPTLLVTTVELGPFHSGTITLYEGDDPRDVAEAFCVAHGLPLTVAEPLVLHILDNLDNLEVYDVENTPELSQAEDIQAAASLPRSVSTSAESEVPQSVPRSARRAATQPPPPPLARPSSSTSALATEYYGRPIHSASAALGRTAEAAAAPAADRLYADHFRKQAMLEEQRRIRDLETQLATQQVYCTPVSRALAAHRTAGGYGSYGERLYAEGRLEALKRDAEAAQMRAEEAEAEIAAATFRPDISKMAKELKARAGRPGSAGSGAPAPWDRLYSQGSAMKRERRAEAIRKEQDEAELKECSFRPRVNSKSQAMVAARRGAATGLRDVLGGVPGDGFESSDGEFLVDNKAPVALPLHERLYNEGRHAAAKAAEAAAAWLPEGATFRPRVNHSSAALKDLVAAADGDADGALARDVAERLLLRGRRYQERLEAARAAAEEAVDDEGRPLFRPHTLPPPPGLRKKVETRAGPIGEHLYGAALESSAKAGAQAAAARAAAERAATAKYVNATSEKLMGRLRHQRVAAIFDFLGQAASAVPMNGVFTGGIGTDAPVAVAMGQEGILQQPAPAPRRINLLGVLRDEAFMDGIDPEVRADVEHASRILERTLHRLAGHEPIPEDAAEAAGDTEEWTLGPEPPLSARSIAPKAESLWITPCGAPGEVTEAGFQALMSEVLQRTRGIARQYLQPLPSTRKKWDDPTFRPAVDPTSLALAERLRPQGLPAHELLYRTAQEAADRLEVAKAERDAVNMRECSFKPALVATNKATKGRALALAAAPPLPRRDTAAEAAAVEARTVAAEEAELAAAHTALAEERARRRREALASAAGSVAPRPRTASSLPLGVEATPGPNLTYSALQPGGSSVRKGSVVGSVVAEALTPAALLFGADGESLEQGIDAIERQIQEAMARLSMTGESFAVRLAGRGAAAAQPPLLEPVHLEAHIRDSPGAGAVENANETPLANAPELAARLRASIDYHALFGADSSAKEGTDAVAASDFNPVGDGDGATPAVPPPEAQPERAINMLAQLAAMPLEFAECTDSSC